MTTSGIKENESAKFAAFLVVVIIVSPVPISRDFSGRARGVGISLARIAFPWRMGQTGVRKHPKLSFHALYYALRWVARGGHISSTNSCILHVCLLLSVSSPSPSDEVRDVMLTPVVATSDADDLDNFLSLVLCIPNSFSCYFSTRLLRLLVVLLLLTFCKIFMDSIRAFPWLEVVDGW